MTNMDLERLFELVFSNPDNIHIEYTSIDGRESLIVNGEELIPKRYDDTPVKEYISKFRDNIKQLDDSIFLEVTEEASEIIDVQSLDELLDQDSFTQEEAELIYGQLNFINSIIHEKLTNKVQDLIELIERI